MARLTGSWLIEQERIRQRVEEGYGLGDDAAYTRDQLARAAACYATPASNRSMIRHFNTIERGPVEAPATWPWPIEAWKPTPEDRVRELVKAGALIAAEIDRLLAAQEDA